jgi:hypothetical protein
MDESDHQGVRPELGPGRSWLGAGVAVTVAALGTASSCRAPLTALVMTAVTGCAAKGGNTFTAAPGEKPGASSASSSGGGLAIGTLAGGDAALGTGPAGSPMAASSVTFTGPLAGPFTDFPADPILDTPDGGAAAVPANSPQLFGPASQGAAAGGPCLLETGSRIALSQ